ncbi:MAG TPA: U32 family peptidase [Polyangiaceae bacterium]|nr:U32 family peptidase [Polyangiaceae bacterium]
MTLPLPEVLAPAGDAEAMQAAVRAGADAVYFGLQGLNARARATNFSLDGLPSTVAELHRHEVKAYVALNTLVFDSEAELLDQSLAACAAAGVDALIVQDLAVMRRAREVAPEIALHASTQMTCTDAASVNFAAQLGARRVVLARELSLEEIRKIRASSTVELEVFVHGALCVAYSGQCLTSEAIGGRSANRGACAQACRLPYELYVDGVRKDLGERAYLLSPEDLEASALVPELAALGVRSLKIEGRLKGPEYVAAVTTLYRRAVDALAGAGPAPDQALRTRALQTFSRGSGPGFLKGVDHQRLVEARSCDHRGVLLGRVIGVNTTHARSWLHVELEAPVARGDGVLIEGGFASEGEAGGRVWAVRQGQTELENVLESGRRVELWLGPETALKSTCAGRRVFKTNDPRLPSQLERELEAASGSIPLNLLVRARVGAPLEIRGQSARGRWATVIGEQALTEASGHPATAPQLIEKLDRLGGTPYRLGQVELDLAPNVFVPASLINRLRRQLTDTLGASDQARTECEIPLAPALTWSEVPPPDAGLFALCRSLPQARAALEAGASGVYLDFLELTGLGAAFRALREEFPNHVLGVAPPRVRKPDEQKIDRYLLGLEPDCVLVRGLGALSEARNSGVTKIGDFSLNVVSRGSAQEVMAQGLRAFTPAFDLDGSQLLALVKAPVGAYAEVVIHHPMPLFHMEHCVYAALLSDGSDFHSCGRPCERHELELRDRSGRQHPVVADVGCRNTVFHGASQSAANLLPSLRAAGVRRFRIELLRETDAETRALVNTYRHLIAGELTPIEAWKRVRAESGYGVVRGSLRVL